MIIFESIQDIKEHCLKVTSAARAARAARAAEVAPRSSVSTAPLSPYAAALFSVWEKADFGSYTDSVTALLAALVKHKTGEEGVFVGKKQKAKNAPVYDYPKYAAVVPLVEASGHDYPIGLPFFVVKKEGDMGNADDGWRMGEEGPGNYHCGAWRYATDEEIDVLFASLEKNRAFVYEELS